MKQLKHLIIFHHENQHNRSKKMIYFSLIDNLDWKRYRLKENGGCPFQSLSLEESDCPLLRRMNKVPT